VLKIAIEPELIQFVMNVVSFPISFACCLKPTHSEVAGVKRVADELMQTRHVHDSHGNGNTDMLKVGTGRLYT